MSDHSIQIADNQGHVVIDGIYPNLQIAANAYGNSGQLATGYTIFDWSGGLQLFGSAVINLPQAHHTSDPPIILLRTNQYTWVNVRWYANNGSRLTGPGSFNQIILLWGRNKIDQPIFFEWQIAGRAYEQHIDYGLEVRDADNRIVYHSALREIIYLDTVLSSIQCFRAAAVEIPHNAPYHYPDQIPYFVGGTGAYADGWNRFSDWSTLEGFSVLFSSGSNPLNSVRAQWMQYTYNGGSGMPGWGGTELPSTNGYTYLSDMSTTQAYIPVVAVVCEVPPA